MSLSEFELIKRYFDKTEPCRSDVILGIGDDCALLQPPVGQQLAVSTDTLVSGIHFFPDVDPEALGHKALAVNLSDLAAMGARPAWVTLAITLPQADEAWLVAFSQGFSHLAREHQLQLVGGDTTRGPLSITVQVMGFVDPQGSLRRDAAVIGDSVYVTGTIGDAALALQQLQSGNTQISQPLLEQLLKPQPRVGFGCAATSYARCAIDISDGLLADLGHIAEASQVGLDIELDTLPLSTPYIECVGPEDQGRIALAGGDDYELCLTVSAENRKNIEQLANRQGLRLTCVGRVVAPQGIRCLNAEGEDIKLGAGGFDHFRCDDEDKA